MPFSKRANHTQGGMARGGTLAVADGRLVFTPHALDRRLGGTELDVSLTDIVEVGIEPRSGNVFDGGLRARLRVELADGRRELFVVNGVKNVIGQLRVEVEQARRGDG